MSIVNSQLSVVLVPDSLPLILILCLSAVLFYTYGVYTAIIFLRDSPPINPEFHPPVTILKPLCGIDQGTYTNLASFCQQNYPQYQIIFSVRSSTDPSIEVIEKLIQQFPEIDINLLVKDQIIGANLKISNLANAVTIAKYDILVIADSDIRVGSEYLKTVIQPLQDQKVGVVTCLYRSTAQGIATILEAICTATDFQVGILVSKQLEGIKFALGSTIVIRKTTLTKIGGFAAVADYLADDYQLGYLPTQIGEKVVLSNYIVEHGLGHSSLLDSINRQIRWARCIRVSRPWGYGGLIFTFGTISSLLLLITNSGSIFSWLVFSITFLMRLIMAWLIGVKLLNDSVTKKYFWLIPIADIVRFIIWCCGFFGNTIKWRGTKFKLVKDGKLEIGV
ncbi:MULTISPECIES: bacteriohopanetetrol glucosamine biosynthesis glycosyltransferase HpnI [Aphanizomenon]|jgi:ceramide glucosyltransferase|uniref:Bacteriohopanetetrol glucosamine biosynthesis glycosyltransferase HpnI n=2 Tax=Aphanizomenon flos-aquae TaxID=1176 RepID=A0ABR8IRA2_APHFL|nr:MULTISPECIES: bacteriohopanetetrol glucosamine biosynthesis glycosyltransferase HpnI [Aphanizomenon]MBD2390288.1 bacteriohopanetetrol glucosamine biosynthesis glycosyltransferase HpnI [Aphanizomenon flos-aquae FACHB-1171]MBD2555571.1 bacteriohopanetetrol glucosamine biosynthesis glycosyltransferase HpnI [Aphanizomenon flos-aquae FACHB-1290]MBD2631430.1 bacteriohopanetetrol glucosamine biosynthesis glycosyltransferase HpnI [Aphanizomenon sp. FACHB-1399]MBD2642526.1 bacteriohopanetetrol glucos